MSGGWQNSTRRVRLPRDWAERRQLIIDRDRGLCQEAEPDGAAVSRRTGARICGASGTEVDHVRPGDDHSLENLRLLCATHHGRKSAAEGGNAYIPLHRPADIHPSLR